MNSAVEIHDSVLVNVTSVGRDLILSLSPAYVHRSAGRPLIDAGSGWLQDLDIIITDAVVGSLPSELPIDLQEGLFSVDGRLWENSIPVTLNVLGPVSLTIVTGQGESLNVRGTGASVATRGELRYVEDFMGSTVD